MSRSLWLLWVGMGVSLVSASAFAGGQCPDGFAPGKDTRGVERCIQNGSMTCPPGFSQQRDDRKEWACIQMKGGACPANVPGRVYRTANGLERCVANDYDKCPADTHLDLIQRRMTCVSNQALGRGAPAASAPAAGTPAAATPAASGDCPKVGFHMGKDVHGVERCIQNGLRKCPDGYKQFVGEDKEDHCMSDAIKKQGDNCGPATQLAKDVLGHLRCELVNYDKCPDGFRIGQTPGMNQFHCMK
jgi:hypothetical protein